MRGIKIPQYEFALKMQGGLMREGGRICGTLRYMGVLRPNPFFILLAEESGKEAKLVLHTVVYS